MTLGGTLSGVSLTSQVSGTLPVGNGGTGTATAFTSGSVVFAGASGVYSQNNAQFFWDNTNNRLGIGNASPGASLDVTGNMRFSAASPNLEFNNGGPMVYSPAANTLAFAKGGGPGSPIETMRIASDGAVGIGNSSPNATLHLQGIKGGNGRMTQSSTSGTSLTNLNLIASSSAGSADQWFSFGVSVSNYYFIQNGTSAGSSGLVIDSSNIVKINTTSTPSFGLPKLVVDGGISGKGTVVINSSTATTIAEGAGLLLLIRDTTNGGTAVVSYENAQTPIIISTSGGTTFQTGTPSGSAQIQLASKSGNLGVSAKSSSDRNGDTLSVTILQTF